MSDQQKRAYLEAMGIDVWRMRQQPVVETEEFHGDPGIRLGPGNGSTLLICADNTDSSSKLANDIVRALGNMPVWAWPQDDGPSTGLASTVDEHLFTVVAVFGDELAGHFFGGDVPGNIKAAKLVVLPSMQAISSESDSRKQLWHILCRAGMVSVN